MEACLGRAARAHGVRLARQLAQQQLVCRRAWTLANPAALLAAALRRAGFFRQGILSVLIKPDAQKSQYFLKGSMPCSVAPEIS